MGVIEPRTRRWTKEEYHRLAEQGFFGDERVQLIDGEIVETSPQRSSHAVAVGLVIDALRLLLGSGCHVREQMPFDAGARSEPEPDVAVAPGSRRDYAGAHPRTASLLVEVADTTLEHDRTEKARLYGRAGVQEYWIVNLVDGCLEVHTGLRGDGYAAQRTLGRGESVRPAAAPAGAGDVAVDDLLP